MYVYIFTLVYLFACNSKVLFTDEDGVNDLSEKNWENMLENIIRDHSYENL